MSPRKGRSADSSRASGRRPYVACSGGRPSFLRGRFVNFRSRNLTGCRVVETSVQRPTSAIVAPTAGGAVSFGWSTELGRQRAGSRGVTFSSFRRPCAHWCWQLLSMRRRLRVTDTRSRHPAWWDSARETPPIESDVNMKASAVALLLFTLPAPPVFGQANANQVDQAIITAAKDGDTSTIRTLLEDGADANTQNAEGRTALWEASGRGHSQIVELLLASGADVDRASNVGTTAIWAASNGGHTRIVQLLLAKGADVDTRSDIGTALLAASAGGHSQIVQLLLEGGADAMGSEDVTPLMMASLRGHDVVVQLLLAHGADVDSKEDEAGMTALLVASQSGRAEIVRLLLVGGADVELRSADGRSALDVARGELVQRFLREPEAVEEYPCSVREAQTRLSLLGYDAHGVDGQWGPRTSLSVQSYQRDTGLPETGLLSLFTCRALAKNAEEVADGSPEDAADEQSCRDIVSEWLVSDSDADEAALGLPVSSVPVVGLVVAPSECSLLVDGLNQMVRPHCEGKPISLLSCSEPRSWWVPALGQPK